MRSKITFQLFLLFVTKFAFSQNEKLFYGKIVVKDATTEGVRIINLMNENEAVSDKKGTFSILAKPDDLLVFSAVHLDYMRKIIEASDYSSDVLIIQMTSKITELDEVQIVDYSHINAESLGIAKGVKTYTPAERRLRTAGDFKPIHLLSILGGTLPVDPILNAINGRTKRLKKELNIEKKEMYLSKLEELYAEDFYIDKLKIQPEYVNGFKYFLIEDAEFVDILDRSNEAQISLLMSKLSIEYNTHASDEKQ